MNMTKLSTVQAIGPGFCGALRPARPETQAAIIAYLKELN